MNSDWKSALESLRDSLDEPESSHEDPPVSSGQQSPSQSSPLYIVTEKKGRKGKTATIIQGFSIPFEEVEAIARQLKQLLGVGGSVRESEILIQGDCKEKIKKFLISKDFKVKG